MDGQLFDPQDPLLKHWGGMPEFDQQDLEPLFTLKVHFASIDDLEAFSKLIEQPLTTSTRSVWYPEAEIGRYVTKRYVDESAVSDLYPEQGSGGEQLNGAGPQ